ncbi:hypothetical protein [Listeria fleischmannii]|jgi:hypothetical protein|uniref:hypothetical protein n=1 Tax=Listeria fleischmannii TaxID=1069827 RepID=UPI0016288354|nr:hypothetical protein [Listeria fleischmannii]MBC1419148.1 hypothetical protein [Listeria fleischmannii]
MVYIGVHTTGKIATIKLKESLYWYNANLGVGFTKHLDIVKRLAQADSFTVDEHKRLLRQVHEGWYWEEKSTE